jgi:Uma2 family endonuclease
MLAPALNYRSPLVDRPGWIPPDLVTNWDPNPYAYQTEEELMPAGGPHGQLLTYLAEVLRLSFKQRRLMLLADTFLLYRDAHHIKRRVAPDLLLMPFRAKAPSSYDLDVEPPPPGVMEITSPSSHVKDLEDLVPFYLGLGISTYLVIDAITPQDELRKQIQLHAWQVENGQPVKVAPDAAGRLVIPTLGLTVHALGQRLTFVDSVTGEVLMDVEQWQKAFEAQRQRAKAEAQRAEAATQRAEAEAQRAKAEAQRAEAEAQRATLAEQTNAALQQEKDQLRAELEAALAELARLKARSRQ